MYFCHVSCTDPVCDLSVYPCSPVADRGAGSEAELDSSITEGPSFSESLKHFRSFAGGRSASPASGFNKVRPLPAAEPGLGRY